MRRSRLKIFTLLLLSIGITGLQAQVANTSSGGNASGNGGSASYSVGQISFNTNTGTNGYSTEGIQQPYEISEVTGISETGISLNMLAYPNPTTDFLKLKVENKNAEDLIYHLLDINGKILEIKENLNSETEILMSSYKAGTYFLKVIQNSNEVKIFKIIKK